MSLLHRCRFIKWMPEAVNHIDISPIGTRPFLAIVRNNGDVEILDGSQNWAGRRIPCGGAVGRAIEVAQWLHPVGAEKIILDQCLEHEEWQVDMTAALTKDKVMELPLARLFTAGHDGNIVEWDIQKLKPKRILHTGGGGIWCMTRSPDEKNLAVGCEDGTIRIVSVADMKVLKTFPPKKGRMLSIAWSKIDPDVLAVGTAESNILIWSVNTGQLQHKIRLQEASNSKATMVWCLKFVDRALVSGDSTGQVQFWNVDLGTAINSFKAHKVDVLAISVHSSKRRIFAVAADGSALEMVSLKDSEDGLDWRPAKRFSNHTHDIRTSVCGFIPCVHQGKDEGGRKIGAHEVLFTAGIDAKIVLYNPQEGKKFRETFTISFIPQKPLVRLAPKARLLASSFGGIISLYSLGRLSKRTLDSVATEGHHPAPPTKSLRLAKPGRLVLEMKIPHSENLASLDISSDGQLLAYTTRSTLRVYHLKLSFKENFQEIIDVEVHKIPISKNEFGIAQMTAFSPDSRYLAVTYLNEDKVRLVIYAFNQDMGGISIVREMTILEGSDAVAIDSVNWGEKYIAFHTLNNVVLIVDTLEDLVHLRLENLSTWVETIRFLPTTPETLVLITVDRQVHCYSTVPKFELNRSYNLSDALTSDQSQHILGLATKPGQPNHLRLWSDKQIIQVDLDSAIPIDSVPVEESQLVGNTKKNNKKSKTTGRSSSGKNNLCGNFIVNDDYGYILLLDYLPSGEAVLVERPLDTILTSLPKPHARKRFGGF